MMTPRELPNLHNDEVFGRLADGYASDRYNTAAIEKLRDCFVNVFFKGAQKGVEAGFTLYCKDKGLFDYLDDHVHESYSDILGEMYKDTVVNDKIGRIFNNAQLQYIDEALHYAFIEGAQRGLRKGYEKGERDYEKLYKLHNKTEDQ